MTTAYFGDCEDLDELWDAYNEVTKQVDEEIEFLKAKRRRLDYYYVSCRRELLEDE